MRACTRFRVGGEHTHECIETVDAHARSIRTAPIETNFARGADTARLRVAQYLHYIAGMHDFYLHYPAMRSGTSP